MINVLNDLKSHTETFSSVARKNNISPTPVASIFDHHVQISRKTLPKHICIDEVYSFSFKHSKYVCVLLDYDTKDVIDALNSRKNEDLQNYLKKIPLEKSKICLL